MEPQIIFEDESLVVIDKPYGIVVNKAESVHTPTIQDWHQAKIQDQILAHPDTEFAQKGGIVHRLDKDTSGIMVLAKTLEAYMGLKQQFLERKTVKRYVALVHGIPKKESDLISAPIERHPKARYKFTIGTDLSRMSITEWKIAQRYQYNGEPYALLELSPHTGRTHQLRVHLQHIKHPIVSDPLYGFAKQIDADEALCPRMFLHAKFLEFTHPITHEKVHFESKIPTELQAVLENLVH